MKPHSELTATVATDGFVLRRRVQRRENVTVRKKNILGEKMVDRHSETVTTETSLWTV